MVVEKGKDYPIRKPRILFKRFLHKYISRKFSKVLDCSTCLSFWTTLIIDIILFIITYYLLGTFYFFWPFSGFATAGITWTIIEILNILDSRV
ncbi:MAG: hypothetical protein ACOCP8_04195 [archaeon]